MSKISLIPSDMVSKVLSCSGSLAKDIIEQAKEQLGGYFPLNKRLSIRRSVSINDEIGLTMTRNAFEVIKRYFRRKYTLLGYNEYTNDGVIIHFCIYFYINTYEKNKKAKG